MARCLIIAELATNHGGDMGLAVRMIQAAAEAGADIVKTQAYQIRHLSPRDPQYRWFAQSALSLEDHRRLSDAALAAGLQYLTTVYRMEDFNYLCSDPAVLPPLTHVKVGSGESLALAAQLLPAVNKVYCSVAWPKPTSSEPARPDLMILGTAPLYPMPDECYGICAPRAGWSDHSIGLTVPKLAIARGAVVLEKHFHLVGQGCREQSWNMNPAELAELRDWAERCAVALDGTRFAGRWGQERRS